jgi:hypothetical protein
MVYRGALPNGEVWQTGFWFTGSAPTSNAGAAAVAQAEFSSEGTTTSSSFWNVFKSHTPSSVTLTAVIVYSYPNGGTQAQFIGQSAGTPLAGTGATTALPNQVSMCMSLLTGQAGRSYRGRMYLPPLLGAEVTATGLWVTTTAASIANVWGVKFTNFNAASGFGKVAVVSQKRTSATQVLQLRIDYRPDVQRRRANRMTNIGSTVANVTP